jgi:hypothetical protein
MGNMMIIMKQGMLPVAARGRQLPSRIRIYPATAAAPANKGNSSRGPGEYSWVLLLTYSWPAAMLAWMLSQ